jgi:hypothetical protein
MADENQENSRANTEKSRETPEHLKPYLWKAGEPSPNPSGRPKRRPITDIYEKILADENNVAKIEQMVLQMILGGRMAGQLQLKEMAERVEGKITQPVEVEINMTLAQRMEKAAERIKE